MNWEGVEGASEHRTVGEHRAWCHEDREWCYPDDTLHCQCCFRASPKHDICPRCDGEGHIKLEDYTEEERKFRDGH